MNLFTLSQVVCFHSGAYTCCIAALFTQHTDCDNG